MASWIDGFYDNPWLKFVRGKYVNNLIDYLQVNNSDIIDIKPKSLILGTQPFPWDVVSGTKIQIDPICLSGCGKINKPIELISDGEVWAPCGEQILYSTYAPYSSFIGQITGNASGSAVAITLPGGNPVIPSLFTYLGMGVRVIVTYKHAGGASAPYTRILFGNSNSTSSVTLADGNVSASGDELTYDVIARITTLGISNAGKYTSFGSMRDSKGLSKSLNTSYGDKACSNNTDFYVVIACFPNSQTINIQRLQVSLVP